MNCDKKSFFNYDGFDLEDDLAGDPENLTTGSRIMSAITCYCEGQTWKME